MFSTPLSRKNTSCVQTLSPIYARGTQEEAVRLDVSKITCTSRHKLSICSIFHLAVCRRQKRCTHWHRPVPVTHGIPGLLPRRDVKTARLVYHAPNTQGAPRYSYQKFKGWYQRVKFQNLAIKLKQFQPTPLVLMWNEARLPAKLKLWKDTKNT